MTIMNLFSLISIFKQIIADKGGEGMRGYHQEGRGGEGEVAKGMACRPRGALFSFIFLYPSGFRGKGGWGWGLRRYQEARREGG